MKPRCLLKICFRRTCLFAPEIRSWGAHQTPTIGGTQGFSGSGFGGNGEIPWDPPRKVWKPRIFGQKLPKMSPLIQSAWTGFFFQMSGFPTFKPKRVAMLARVLVSLVMGITKTFYKGWSVVQVGKLSTFQGLRFLMLPQSFFQRNSYSRCTFSLRVRHEFPVPARYQYRAKPLKSRLPYAKNKFSKRCQISNGSKMATKIANDQPVQPSTRWVFWWVPEPLIPHRVNLSIHVLTSKRSGSSWSSNL